MLDDGSACLVPQAVVRTTRFKPAGFTTPRTTRHHAPASAAGVVAALFVFHVDPPAHLPLVLRL
jgi:hypothetical protein